MLVQVDGNHNRYAIAIDEFLFDQLHAKPARPLIGGAKTQAPHSTIVHFFNTSANKRTEKLRSLRLPYDQRN